MPGRTILSIGRTASSRGAFPLRNGAFLGGRTGASALIVAIIPRRFRKLQRTPRNPDRRFHRVAVLHFIRYSISPLFSARSAWPCNRFSVSARYAARGTLFSVTPEPRTITVTSNRPAKLQSNQHSLGIFQRSALCRFTHLANVPSRYTARQTTRTHRAIGITR